MNHFAENSQIFIFEHYLFKITDLRANQISLIKHTSSRWITLYCIVTIKIELNHDSVSLTGACIVGLLSL